MGRSGLSWVARIKRAYGFCFKEFHSFCKSPSLSARSSLEPQRVVFVLLLNKKDDNKTSSSSLIWAAVDSNHRPHPYQGCALTTWASSPYIIHILFSKPLSWAYPYQASHKNLTFSQLFVRQSALTTWASSPYSIFIPSLS